MKIVELIRLENNPRYGSFGVVKVQKKVTCISLEPPDKLNASNVSCIPTGQYSCEIVDSPKYGKVFEVKNVPGRDHVLIHAGNTVNHTHGCIIMAQHFGKLKGERAVLNSGNTLKAFMLLMENNPFHLTIKECF